MPDEQADGTQGSAGGVAAPAQHIIVTRNELDAFVSDDDAVQLLVLAELRSQAADQEATLVLALEAATVTILAIMLSRVPTSESATPNLGSGWVGTAAFAIVCVVLAAVAVALALPSVKRAVIGNRNRGRAVVWLGAYEQALAERRQAASPATPRRHWFTQRPQR